MRIMDIDYSDAHQVIKALTERNIPEQAAEVLIAYERFQAGLTRREIDRNYATKEEFRAVQSRQEHIEESQNSHATKHDVDMVKLELQKEIEKNRMEFQRDIEVTRLSLQKEIIESSKRTIRWMVSPMLVHTALITGIIFALIK